MKTVSTGMIRYAKSVALGGMLAVLFGCIFDGQKESRRGSVVENELGVGYLYNEDGTPAVDARVSAYPVDYLPAAEKILKTSADSQIFVARTDAKGRYALKGIPRGEYNILGVLDGGFSYRDSIAVDTAVPSLASDTLRDPGSLAGTVVLQPNHDPQSATVEVLGTNVYSNVDEDGAFLLSGLARGQYRLRISTTVAEYTVLFKTVRIRTGAADTLEEPLRPAFTGIPVVHPVSAEYDTLSGTATVRWPNIPYRNLDTYQVFRRAANFSAPEFLVGETEDTSFVDTLYNPFTGGEGQIGNSVEYRVRIRNKSRISGLSYEDAKVSAGPPYLVRTAFQFRLIDFGETTASIGDTVRIVCTYSNPTRMNQVIRWYADGQTAPIRTVPDFAGTSQDTLTRVWTGAGRYRIRVEADDNGGATWKDSVFINIVLDPPRADAGIDAKAATLDAFLLRGSASQSFGSIVKWEWDVGNTGTFVTTPSGEYLATMPSVPDSNFMCILRVTDDDGHQGTDAVKLRLSPWKTVAGDESRILRNLGTAEDGSIYGIHTGNQLGRYNPSSGVFSNWTIPKIPGVEGYGAILARPQVVALGGLVHVVPFANNTMYVFNPQTEAWTHGEFPEGSDFLPVQSAGGRLYLVSRFPYTASAISMSKVSEYDPATQSWRQRTSIPVDSDIGWNNQTLVTVGDRIFAMGGTRSGEVGGVYRTNIPDGRVMAYDTRSDTWTSKTPSIPVGRWDYAAVVGRGIYLASGEGAFFRYDVDTDQWRMLAGIYQPRSNAAFAAFKGRIYLLAGDAGNIRKDVWVFDPVAETWSQGFPLEIARRSPSVAISGNTIFLFGHGSSNGESMTLP